MSGDNNFHNLNAFNNSPTYLDYFNKEIMSNNGFNNHLDDSINSDESQGIFNNNNNNEQKFFTDPPEFIFSQSTYFTKNNLFFNSFLITQDQNQEENVQNNKYTNKKRERSKNRNTIIKEKKQYGRKKKFNESENNENQIKYNEDNMITKIKICIINSILFLLNNSFIYFNFNTGSFNNKKFLKIEPNIYSSNKRDYNLKMLKMTIRDLFYNDISNKIYKEDKTHNKKLIDEIYKQQKETEVIKLLELTFEEFLNLFRGTISNELEKKLSLIKHIKEKFTNITNFEDKTRKKGIENGETNEAIDSYIQKLKDLCFNYEDWFDKKKSRKEKKK